MGLNGTRSIGTLLMGIGLLLILSVGGYFAWNEVQAAQVRSELDSTSAAAVARATRMAKEIALSTPERGGADAPPTATAPEALSPVKLEPSPTAQPALPADTGTPTRRATATRRATVAGSPTPLPASPTPTAAVAPSPIPNPVLPVRLEIPDLKIDTQVVEMGWNVVQTKNGPVSEWALPKNGAGHHINSAGIGQPDNLVISGHNNIFGRVFLPISQAWSNDKRVKVDNYTDKSDVLDGRELLLFDAAGKEYKYVVTDFHRLKDTGVSRQQREANGRYMLPTGDERVTVITCWPPTNNTHRLIVIARPEK